MKRRTMWCLALGLAGCGTGTGPVEQGEEQVAAQESAASAEEETSASGAALHTPGATLEGWMTQGFCRELAEALGRPVPASNWASVDIPGVIKCFQGYGVDGISLFGRASAGVGASVAPPLGPTALVNGKSVGVMSLELSGPTAGALREARPVWMSPYTFDWQSSGGRITCKMAPDFPTHRDSRCLLQGLVGFSVD